MKDSLRTRLIRISAAMSGAALVLLSWMPGHLQVRTGWSGQAEHVAAYAITGALVGLGWPRHGIPRLAFALAALAAALEIGQLWVPGRNAQPIDFAASAGGALAGLLAARWLGRRV